MNVDASTSEYPQDIPIPGIAPLRGPLLGRDAELADLVAVLTNPDIRLVTITGPGGVGKTRLALAAAPAVTAHFPGGLTVVALAAIVDPDLVLPAIAHALGLRETGERPVETVLADFLRPRRTLLVLDNLEQVLPVAPRLARLLAECPALLILATSRAALRVSGEQEYPLAPLTLPSPDHDDTPLAANPAVALFVQRAQAARHSFALTESNGPVIAEICRRLDGIPLAIELAAAWSKVLSPHALLARLSQRLDLLTGGPRDAPTRLRTMRDAIAWSYDLISPDHQTLFRRLSVFSGSFSLDAADAVGGQGDRGAEEFFRPVPLSPSALDDLTALVEASLLRSEEGPEGEPRFGMFETLREFALDRLEMSGEADTIRRRHARYMLQLAETAEARLTGPDQATWTTQLETEIDNLRAALTWFEHADPASGVRLAGALWLFWAVRGHLEEGSSWFSRLLPAAGHSAAERSRAQAYFGWGTLSWSRGVFADAVNHGEQALALATSAGDDLVAARARFLLGRVATAQKQTERAQTLLEASVEGYRRVGRPAGEGASLRELARLATATGDPIAPRRYAEAAIATNRACGYTWGLANALVDLARSVAAEGDHARATALYRESLERFWSLRDRWYLALPLAGLTRLAADTGHPDTAARLLGITESLRDLTAPPTWSLLRPDLDRAGAIARKALGESGFLAARTAGASLPLDPAIAEAIAFSPSAPAPLPTQDRTAARDATRLTAREMEVLRLLAEGRSNAEIADALFISPRTASTHLVNIFAKLEVDSRASAVARAFQLGIA
jgi:predicted ATPase/DNA-binding CsgD family transcriptional regulator